MLMTLNLVRAFRKENPDTHITYQCHPSISKHLGSVILDAGIDQIVSSTEPFKCDKTYNLIGYPIREGYPEKPMRDHLVRYFAKELGIKDLSDENLFRGFFLPAPKPLSENAYCTVHVQAGWSMYKNWPIERWEEVCRWVQDSFGYEVYQIGGPDDIRLRNANTKMLGQPFRHNLNAMAAAQCHMGIDSWSNHATNIHWDRYGYRTGVILWGSTQSSAAGYPQNQNISANLPCQPCFREDPKISRASRGVCPNPAGQTYEQPRHACMQHISIEMVKEAIEKILS